MCLFHLAGKGRATLHSTPQQTTLGRAKERDNYLEGQIVVFLLLLGPQGIPPLSQDLADSPVILVGVPLVDQGPVPLAEDHEGIHGPTDMVLFPLQLPRSRGRLGLRYRLGVRRGTKLVRHKGSTLPY